MKDIADVKSYTGTGVSIGEQVKIMADSDIVFSNPGSDIMPCVFMRPNTVLIVPNRYFEGSWQESNEVRMWFNHIPKKMVVSYQPNATVTASSEVIYNDIGEAAGHILQAAENVISSKQIGQ